MVCEAKLSDLKLKPAAVCRFVTNFVQFKVSRNQIVKLFSRIPQGGGGGEDNSHCMGYRSRAPFWVRFLIETEISGAGFLSGLRFLGRSFESD